MNEELYLNKPLWYAKLNSGETIVEDYQHPSAWGRLKDKISKESKSIESLKIGFRSNIVDTLPRNAEGYFFRHGIIAPLNSDMVFGRFIIGHLEKDKVYIQKWRIPEMILVEEEIRDINNEEEVGESLILNG